MTYIPTVLIIALILYVWTCIWIGYGRKKGFQVGCRYERDLAARLHGRKQAGAFWIGYN